MSSSYYINLKEDYIRFDRQIQALVKTLTQCNTSATDASDLLNNNYKVDNTLPDNNKLSNCLTSLNETIDYLNNTIRVAISNKIESLNTQIENALLRERED